MLVLPLTSAGGAGPWIADQGDGTYKNPILHADYSDPDAVRVGEDYWMTASSFSHVPGLPILHSRDLVNWQLVAHALPKLVPEEVFRTPQHGKGVWAPAIRHHEGRFWIYYPDPDHGIHLVTATDPRGPWSEPILVKGGKGLIDPCPLWDDDGRVYLVHAWARSRSGIANVLTLLELDPTGTKVIKDHGIVVNGDEIPGYSTLEGPKFLKRDGWYYLFAPAGGVATGWQSVFRAKDIRGPYEPRIILAQNSTPVNGPHQGAVVDTPSGDWWFLHFQDKGPYGRVVHLQPMAWDDGWPLMGTAALDRPNVVPTGTELGQPAPTDVPTGTQLGQPVPMAVPTGTRIGHFRAKAVSTTPGGAQGEQGRPIPPAEAFAFAGEPVLTHTKPTLPPQPVSVPAMSDDFSSATLGRQWQWQANPSPDWASLAAQPGRLRLFGQGGGSFMTLADAPNLLLQKFPAPEFTVTTQVEIAPKRAGDTAGLVVFGYAYAWLGVVAGEGRLQLNLVESSDVRAGGTSTVLELGEVKSPVWLRARVAAGAKVRFSYSVDGAKFTDVAAEFQALPGRWVGAKIGLFATGSGHADFDFFRVD